MDDFKKAAKDLWSNTFSGSTSSNTGKFSGRGHRLGSGEPGTARGAPGRGAGRGGPVPGSSASASRTGSLNRSGAAAERILHNHHSAHEQEVEKQKVARRQALLSAQQQRAEPLSTSPASSVPSQPHLPSSRALAAHDSRRPFGEGNAGEVVQCPVCSKFSGTEDEVAVHVDACLAAGFAESVADVGTVQDVNPATPKESLQNVSSAGTDALEDYSNRAQPSSNISPPAASRGESKLPQDAISTPLGRTPASAPASTPTPPTSSHPVPSCEGEADALLEEVHNTVAELLSASPPASVLDILRKLLSNVAADPGNDKFRRVRMSNPKISDTIGRTPGATDVLLAVGFRLAPEGSDGEVWAVLEQASSLAPLSEVLKLLPAAETPPATTPPVGSIGGDGSSGSSTPGPAVPAATKFDRKLRVFLSTSESAASRIEVPDSFYDRTGEDVRQEMLARRRALEQAQVLMTRASREKQKEALRRRYKLAILRVLLPDGLVLQGLFRPWELTSVLYQFVAECLRDPAQEFQLVHPIPVPGRSQAIPSAATSSSPIPSLQEEDLVPASLVKFHATCLGPPGYTGLRRDLLDRAEPLASMPLPPAETSSR